MKRLTFILLAVMAAFMGQKASAQGKYGADSAECIKYLSYYQEYYKQKNYDSALPNWRKAYAITSRRIMIPPSRTGGKRTPSARRPRPRTCSSTVPPS